MSSHPLGWPQPGQETDPQAASGDTLPAGFRLTELGPLPEAWGGLITLRPARSADLPAVVALDHEAFAPYGTAEAPEVFAQRLAVFPAGFIVAEDAGEVVAYGCSEKWRDLRAPAMNEDPATSHHPDGAAFCITGVAVRRSHRGRGLGLAVGERLLAIAQAQGCRTVVLETTHAQGLWERLGFHRAGERTQNGVTLTIMQRDLD